MAFYLIQLLLISACNIHSVGIFLQSCVSRASFYICMFQYKYTRSKNFNKYDTFREDMRTHFVQIEMKLRSFSIIPSMTEGYVVSVLSPPSS